MQSKDKRRPLPANAKAACFFYLGYALLLLAVTLFVPKRVQPIHSVATSGGEMASSQLLSVSEGFVESWRSTLKETSNTSGSIRKMEEVRLHQRAWRQRTLEWVMITTRLTLPEADDETEVLRIGGVWRELVQCAGLESAAPRWGYYQNKLWVKLEARAVLSHDDQKIKMPIARLAIVQPLSKKPSLGIDWRGIWPAVPESLDGADYQEVPATPLVDHVPEAFSPQDAEPAESLGCQPQARVCIIIDDVGYVRQAADKMLEVPARLTWSILPFTPYGKEYEAVALGRNFEIMLHLPLEPFNITENPGPGLIKRQWSEAAILSQLDENLKEVSTAKGVNNHMGSAGTADGRLMDVLMGELKRRQLFFVDSYTSNQSVAGQFARKHQVPFGKRAIFIDHSDQYESKKKALRELMRLALRDGAAIGIGHVREGTAEAIMEMLPEFNQAGIEIVPASELVK